MGKQYNKIEKRQRRRRYIERLRTRQKANSVLMEHKKK